MLPPHGAWVIEANSRTVNRHRPPAGYVCRINSIYPAFWRTL